ncbi:arginine deiminase family protein, partial [Pseudomonas aeruginosa]
DSVGLGLPSERHSCRESREPRKLAEYLSGGVAADHLPAGEGADILHMYHEYLGHSSVLLQPLPHTQFPRDT